MKIAKEQLKQIIKEELRSYGDDRYSDGRNAPTGAAIAAMEAEIHRLRDAVVTATIGPPPEAADPSVAARQVERWAGNNTSADDEDYGPPPREFLRKAAIVLMLIGKEAVRPIFQNLKPSTIENVLGHAESLGVVEPGEIVDVTREFARQAGINVPEPESAPEPELGPAATAPTAPRKASDAIAAKAAAAAKKDARKEGSKKWWQKIFENEKKNKITKKRLARIIKEELRAVIDEHISSEDVGHDCGAPPGDDQGLWMWAECMCRDVGANNREDEAYKKCMKDHGVYGAGLGEPHPYDEPTTYGGMHPESGEKY